MYGCYYLIDRRHSNNYNIIIYFIYFHFAIDYTLYYLCTVFFRIGLNIWAIYIHLVYLHLNYNKLYKFSPPYVSVIISYFIWSQSYIIKWYTGWFTTAICSPPSFDDVFIRIFWFPEFNLQDHIFQYLELYTI